MRVLGLLLVSSFISACGGSTSGTGSGPVDGGGTGGGGFGGGGFGGSVGGAGGAAGGGLGGSGGGTPGTANPPAPDPNAPPAAGNTPTTIALKRIFLGETDWSGATDFNAWKKYGYDIDGELSDKLSTFHCQPHDGVPKSKIQTDGDGGIDNSFGANLIPIFQNLAANPSQSASEAFLFGDVGQLFHFVNLTPGGASQNAIDSRLYRGTSIPVPTWSGADVWPVTFESVNGGDVAQPKLSFSSAYVVNGTWVSGAPPSNATLELPVPLSGFNMLFKIQHVTITAQFLPSGAVQNGIISGVLDTEELIAEFKKVAGSFDPGLCDGPTFDSIANQLAAASDILLTGTQDPTQQCNAISIGLGFEGDLVVLGSVAPPAPPAPDPCG